MCALLRVHGAWHCCAPRPSSGVRASWCDGIAGKRVGGRCTSSNIWCKAKGQSEQQQLMIADSSSECFSTTLQDRFHTEADLQTNIHGAATRALARPVGRALAGELAELR